MMLAVGVYLIAQQHGNVRRNGEAGALNIARGLEASISARFDQSVASLKGVATDVAAAPRSEAAALHALQNAARYDPFSNWLGVLDSEGRWLVMVDQSGVRATAALEQAVLATLRKASDRGIALQPLLRPSATSEWLMPVTLPVPGGGTVFALVSASRIAAGTESLNLLPESIVALVGSDGTRLLRYTRGNEALVVNGPPLDARRLAQLRAAPAGYLDFFSQVYQRRQIAGFVRSATLPLYVAVLVPVDALDRQWLRDSLGPALVLLLGMIGIVAFGIRLRHALQSQQQALERQRYLAEHDMLTGLLNRDAFARRLRQEIARPDVGHIAMVLVNLSNFQVINDTFGHAVGDDVLIEISRRFGQMGVDEAAIFVARVGGDEWGIGAVQIDGDAGAHALAERLQTCLGAALTLSGVQLELSATMGLAVFPADSKDAIDLIRCADIAVHAGKNDMRRVSRYQQAMDTFSAEALALTSDFARALREGGLCQVYQPKIRLRDGVMVGVEALARWMHPQRGNIAPMRFVPLAENSELIHAFTRLMLAQALAQAAHWRHAGHLVPVAVNISANNLLDADFIDTLKALLEQHQLAPALLELEVTESALMRHAEVALHRLEELRSLGVKLSIDDFGTGYSSLAYLKRLPVHTLKIDQAFVLQMENDAADQRIVRASIQLAHGFGMKVVAEGVESEAAAMLLRDYGCDYAQGYHFARPMPAAELEARWLTSLAS
ncbi:MAG: EAL domain-containing protein [Burkholderiaceae bacterium]